MERVVSKAIHSVETNIVSFSKFITANDVGATGGHQAGFHFHKNSWPLFFKTPGQKGQNKDAFINIKWQEDIITSSRFIYYGIGTRDEYRLTRFGRNFPFLTDNNIGNLLVISKCDAQNYEAYILESDDDIEEFLTVLNLSYIDTNKIISKTNEISDEKSLLRCFETYAAGLTSNFPSTIDISSNSRNCYINSFKVNSQEIINNPDKEILNWLNAEFELFKLLENIFYAKRIKTQFKSVEELIETANSILNRRKSRAGKSLEHHLAEIFNSFGIKFESQAKTEDSKKPDFIFPDATTYKKSKSESEGIYMLAAKTTCKDRWRQILNEADKIKTKHLFTLQQGVSTNQLLEMYKYGVQLVVPSPYIRFYPEKFRSRILSLKSFINEIHVNQL